MASGDERVAWEGVDIEDAKLEMFIDRIEAAGWLSGGGFSPDGETHVGFYRRDGLYTLSPEEIAIRLDLLDKQGRIVLGRDEFDSRTGQVERFGYDIETDPKTGEVVIGYSGPDDVRFQAFFEDLLALGHDLNHQQEAEVGDFKMKLARYVSNPIFRPEGAPASEFLEVDLRPNLATNQLLGQIRETEDEEGLFRNMRESGMSRREVITGITSLTAPAFMHGVLGLAQQAAALEKWYAHVDYRYTKLLEAIQAQYVDSSGLDVALATNPTLEALDGIREGVRQATLRSQERVARIQELEREEEAGVTEALGVEEVLEVELRTFEARLPEFLETHPDEHVLIHQEEVGGFFPTEQEGIKSGYDQYGNVPFLVRQILEEQLVESFPSPR